MIIKNFKESRELLDLKQIDIANQFNIHFSTVSGWETGKDIIPLKRLIEYANKNNFSLDYLFGLTRSNIPYHPLKINLDIIGKNLRTIRKKHNFTQSDIASKINTTQATYAHYENAIYLIPTSFLFNLTKIYKPFSIDLLLGRDRK